MQSINVMKTSMRAVMPTRAHPNDAGLDLYANEGLYIAPGATAKVNTGIAIDIQQGYVGLIWPRSGLAAKFGVDTLAGVIDAGYHGEIVVILINHGDEIVYVNHGDRVAQLLIRKIETPIVVEVSSFADSERGANGFGRWAIK